MTKNALIVLITLAACQPRTAPQSPQSADDAPAEAAAPAAAPAETAAPTTEPAAAAAAVSEELPQVELAPLVELLNAALSGRDLPQTPFTLPGNRGEQVVRVQGAFPGSAMSASAALLKVDVTLEGCGDTGGLALGLLQTADGQLFIVGLGDQFQAAAGADAVGFENVSEATTIALEALRVDELDELRLTDEVCEQRFGSVERCHRVFRELPTEESFARYRGLLSRCQAEPVFTLAVVGLFLADDSGAELQALARFARRGEELALSEPIVLAPGVE